MERIIFVRYYFTYGDLLKYHRKIFYLKIGGVRDIHRSQRTIEYVSIQQSKTLKNNQKWIGKDFVFSVPFENILFQKRREDSRKRYTCYIFLIIILI